MALSWIWRSIRYTFNYGSIINIADNYVQAFTYAVIQDLAEISLNDYVPSNEWDLLAHPGRKNVIYYPCCNVPFPDLTFTLVLKRQVNNNSSISTGPSSILY